MRSSAWVPIAGWCVATATSIVLSSVALSPVLDAARADSGALPDVGRLPAAAEPETTTVLPSPDTTVPARTTKPTPQRSRPTSAGPRPSSKSPSASEAPAAPTKPVTTTEDGWTVTISDGVKTYVKSFTTGGGTAVIRMTGKGVVSLVTATPADGFRVEKQGSDVNLAVYFHQTGKSFIIHAQWFNDAPFVQVSEVGS